MHVLKDPSIVPPPSRPADRVTALPSSRSEIDAWMWRVLSGGKVTGSGDDGENLQQLAGQLRMPPENGDDSVTPALKEKARQYARLLGWKVVEEADRD